MSNKLSGWSEFASSYSTAYKFSPGLKALAPGPSLRLMLNVLEAGHSQQGQEGEQRGHMVLEMKCPHLCREGQGVLWVSGETSGACPSPFWSKKAPCCLQQAKATFWSFALTITDKLPDACQGPGAPSGVL